MDNDKEEVKTMDNDAKDDMFVSAMSDSPTDSGLETNKTSNSDTMEDLSLQVRNYSLLIGQSISILSSDWSSNVISASYWSINVNE